MKRVYWFVCCIMILFASCDCKKSGKEALRNAPKHVIIIGFDGLSSYSLNHGADMPNLRKLMGTGASTLENRSILPSSSACNWASMFMGAGPELHGYTTWGSQTPELPSRVVGEYGMFPGIFGLYRSKDPQAEIGYIFEWSGMNYLVDTAALSYRLNAVPTLENPRACLVAAQDYIKTKKPALCAVIFGEPDGAGHTYGWTSPEYFAQLTVLDSCLGEIVRSVEDAGIMDETVIMVVSDHGGLEANHGGKTMDEMQTPIVFYGKGIKKGFRIPESTMVYDIAATVGYMLDVEQPQVWIARPVVSVFE